MTNAMTLDEDLALVQETNSAVYLVEVGLFLVRDMRNVEHAQLAVLSNGLERMLKLVILVDFSAANSRFPNLTEYNDSMGCKTHDLRSLLRKVVEITENQSVGARALQDLQFLKSPTGVLDNLLGIFSEYGQQGRYHDLNILAGANLQGNDPSLRLEYLLDSTPIQEIVGAIQRLARSLCWIMRGRMSNGLADKMNQLLGYFLYLEDADLSKLTFDWLPGQKEDEPS